jgi:hypothetical protein
MKKERFQEIVKKLTELNSEILKLDPSIRPHAFETLKSYVLEVEEEKPTDRKAEQSSVSVIQKRDEVEKFFSGKVEGKPSDNVDCIAAYLYQSYGSAPFSVEDVSEISSTVGRTVPERIDKTLVAAKLNGKKLFNKVGRNLFKPTVHGEKFLKQKYNVTKGVKKRQTKEGG